MLTKPQLAAIFPNAEMSALDAFITSGQQALKTSGILDGANRLLYFLAQLGHESNGLTVLEENLNYSASRLLQVWPSHFSSLDAAKKCEYKPEQLANVVYGGRMGNVDDGDGYKYRGRGYIQLTGRDTYRAIGKICGLDLEGNPDLASQVSNAPKIACAFWTWKNINPACDNADFTAVTQKINGGTNGLSDRLAWLSKVQSVLTATLDTSPAAGQVTTAPAVDGRDNVTGGASQITEQRTGRLNGNQFFESLGGTLIASRGTFPEVVEQVSVTDRVRTFRISTNTLGEGYVESISNDTLIAIRDAQPALVRGTAILVPVLEGGDGSDRVIDRA